MKIKTFEIPIYQAKLTVILDKDLSYVEKKYKTSSLDNFGAVTLPHPSVSRHYIVAFTDATHLSNIAHEIVHLKNHIYLDCAMQLCVIKDEPEAYLTGYLFDLINNFLNPSQNETN